MNQEKGKLDFLTGQCFDQLYVSPTSIRNNAFTAALKELTPDMMKRLNIEVVVGTMMRVSIVDHDVLWTTYRSKMIESLEKLETLVKSIVESQQGILVKIVDDSFICFFPDKNKARSSIVKSVYSACRLRTELEEHPIYMEETVSTEGLRVAIVLSYGTTWKRCLHIQRKILYDYYGEVMDTILNQKQTVSHPEHILFLNCTHRVKEDTEDTIILQKEP